MRGFYWLIEGVLAGCPRPGGTETHPRAGSAGDQPGALDDDLDWLREHEIGAILSLTERPLDAAALARHGMVSEHIPVDDLTAPTPAELERALRFIDQQRGQGHAVAVHCRMGQGRTGTVLAAYLIRAGMSPEDAMRELRRLTPGAIGVSAQEHALQSFATRRDWIV